MHVSSRPPVIPETVLPKKEEDLVWQVMKDPRPLPAMPAATQGAEKARPAWTHSPWLDKPTAPDSSLPSRVDSPKPTDYRYYDYKRPALFQNTTDRWGERVDERAVPEQTSGTASGSTQANNYTSAHEQPSSVHRRERSLRSHKGKEVERTDDITDNYNQDLTASDLPPPPIDKPVLRPSAQASPEASSYRPTSPDVASRRPISPPPRFQSLDNRDVFNDKPQTIPFSLQNQRDTEDDGMLSGMSSPAVSPRAASPLPLPPQVQTQTKPSRPLKSHAHGSNKRHLQEVSNYSIYSSFFSYFGNRNPGPPPHR